MYLEQSIQEVLKVGNENLEEIFNEVKEKLLLDWANFYLEQSYHQAFTLFDNATISNSFEPRSLRKILNDYSYSDFKRDQANWLANGRQTWLISGNLEKEEAISIVKGARASFNLKGLEVGDLQDIRALSIDKGHYYHIDAPLEDEQNENSCAVTYYEVGISEAANLKPRLTNLVMM